MGLIAKSSVPSIQRKVNDPNGDYATPEYCYGFMDDAQKLFYNAMLAKPIISQPSALIIIPSIGVGITTLQALFADGQPFARIDEIVSLKERPVTSTSESDWRKMTPTFDIPAMTAGSFNSVYQYDQGNDIRLPGASQDLMLRFFGTVRPTAITNDNSTLVPSTDTVIELLAAFLIATARGNDRLAKTWFALADSAQGDYFNRIIQEKQSVPTRQKPFSGRMRTSL